MRTLPYALVLATCISTSSSAQEQLPRPEPGKAHLLFARDAGTWDCEVKMYFRGPEAAPTAFKGVEVNKLVSGDLYLQTSFTCQMGDREFEGHSLMGYDPRSKKYVGTWVDNFSSVPTQLAGEYDEKTRTLTIHSAAVDAASGQELQQKQTTRWIDDSRKSFEIVLVVDVGGKQTDVKLMEMTAKKRK